MLRLNLLLVTCAGMLWPRVTHAQTVEEAREKMLLHAGQMPSGSNLLLTDSPPIREAKSLKETGIVITVIGAAATTFGWAWIGYEAAHPPNCRPASSADPLNLGPALCDAFSGFRYVEPATVVLFGALVGIGGGMLWHRGAKQLARARAHLSAGPGSVALTLRW
ncbi:MAG TPA: hypothetical protein VKN99_02115 [Polyangia bacterium]|nr:hypothetical protein [Polyangia bacterium]